MIQSCRHSLADTQILSKLAVSELHNSRDDEELIAS